MMAVRGIDNRRFSYGQSGVSNQLYYYGSGRIGVTEDGTARVPDHHQLWKRRGCGSPFFDAKREDESHASDHVSIIDR